MSEPIERRGVRVLLVDPAGRVLMLRGHDPARPGVRYWFTVGGGVRPGESDAEAAVREVFEETGMRIGATELAGPVHHELSEFPFDGRHYRQSQDFYVVRVGAGAGVDFGGFEPHETASIDAYRWWSAAQLRAGHETTYPPELADVLDNVLGAGP